MIIVDDRLTLEILAGRHVSAVSDDDAVATTWGFHYRLARALAAPVSGGQLSGGVPARQLLDTVLSPRPGGVEVLDPRAITREAVAAAARHGLNLLAAELVGAARHHEATIALSAANVGRSWPAVFEAEGIELRVVTR